MDVLRRHGVGWPGTTATRMLLLLAVVNPTSRMTRMGSRTRKNRKGPVAGHPLELSGGKGERGHRFATRRRSENATAPGSARGQGWPSGRPPRRSARQVGEGSQSPAIGGRQREGADQCAPSPRGPARRPRPSAPTCRSGSRPRVPGGNRSLPSLARSWTEESFTSTRSMPSSERHASAKATRVPLADSVIRSFSPTCETSSRLVPSAVR